MAIERSAWWELTPEEPLDPALPICDSHHHLWDRQPHTKPEDRFLLEEVLREFNRGHNIVSSVSVTTPGAMFRKDGPEEMKPVGETEFVQGIAAMSASGKYGSAAIAAGIVGYADLTLGARVAPVLEAHLAASCNRFRGIRYGCSWDASSAVPNAASKAPKGLMLDRTFREGVACLQKYNLIYDALCFHPQLPELVDLARAVPEVSMVLEHAGCPLGVGPYAGRGDEVFQDWKRSMAELATCPNVTVKLGGLGFGGRFGYDWPKWDKPPSSAQLVEAIGPYFLACIELFGPERCMFQSNFPVDGAAYSYIVIWNSFKRMTRDFSPAERAALFRDTAERVYRIAAPSGQWSTRWN